MSDTAYPTAKDTPRTLALLQVGTGDDIDGSGDNMSDWMRQIDTAVAALQDKVGITSSTDSATFDYYKAKAARKLGGVTGVTRSNTSSAGTILSSSITVPAGLLVAQSALTLHAYGTLISNNTTTTQYTWTPKFGSTTAVDIATAPAGSSDWTSSATAHKWELNLEMVAESVGASATIHSFGSLRISVVTSKDMDGSAGADYHFAGGGVATVDTTAAIAVGLNATMTTAHASHSITCAYCSVGHIPKF